MMIFDLAFGFLLVFAGRNFFWLCVGIVGFLIGVQCAGVLGYSSGWMVLVSALALGSVGIVLAVSFQWFMVVFGIGFLGGGYLLMNIFSAIISQEFYTWPIFIVGGIVGMCLMVIIFDWTLIMISSLLGAMLIANAFHGTQSLHELLFLSSAAVGILAQYLTLKGIVKQKRFARRA